MLSSCEDNVKVKGYIYPDHDHLPVTQVCINGVLRSPNKTLLCT